MTDGASTTDSASTTDGASTIDGTSTTSTTTAWTTAPSTTGASTDEDLSSTTAVAPPCNHDGIIDPGEACDDGNFLNDDGCEDDCTVSPPGTCHDGVLDWDEECDDGNNQAGDGCVGCKIVFVCPDQDTFITCDGATTSPFQVIELGCSLNPKEAVLLEGEIFHSSNADAWRLAKGFGSYAVMGKSLYSPRRGNKLLMLSTGVIAQPNGQGLVLEANNSQVNNGDNGNDDSDTFPANISVKKGSDNGSGGSPFVLCDGVNDCSDTLAPFWGNNGNINDKIWLTFGAKVPMGVKGWSLDFAYFSSEWPTWVNTPYNDLFVVWQVSEVFTGNTTFVSDKPLTITSLDDYLVDHAYTFNEPQLAGTGFETHAGSDWLRINQNVLAGETVYWTILLGDIGDSSLATAVVLDNFRWSCTSCIPATMPLCTGGVLGSGCCGVVAE